MAFGYRLLAMDSETRELDARLRAAGAMQTAQLPVSSTLRPDTITAGTLEMGAAATLAASRASLASQLRPLPRISVDLRRTDDARQAPVTGGTADLEVQSLIGEGGMGRVFLARQHSLERDVAVKTTKEGASDSVRDALLVERAITGRLEHPAIVPVHVLGVDEAGRPAMVMKRIEGVAWNVLIQDPAHPGWEGWEGEPGDRLSGHLQILRQICNALHFAHSRGIVHRDVKPENVLIGRFGDVYLADWGVAGKVGEEESRLCGTPGYMAPEMVGAGRIDARTDVYLLGATLHEVLTGRMRHEAQSALEALIAARLSEPCTYDASVPVELAALANASCHVDPARRPASALAFRDALASYVEHRDSVALASEAATRLDRLDALLAVEAPSDADRADIDRLTAEASFGLAQALRQWPGNAQAQQADARLQKLLSARRARAAELERDARERDPSVSSTARAKAISVLAAFGALMSLYGVFVLGDPTPVQLVIYPAAIVVVLAVGTVALRKQMLATTFNRQVVLIMHGVMLLLVLGRAQGLFVDITPATHFARDGFVLAAGFGVLAVAYLPWVGWVASITLVSGVLCSFYPDQALAIFALSTAVGLAIAAGFSWRSSTA